MMYCKMLQVLNKWRTRQSAGKRSPLDDGLGFTIRFAYPDDDLALRQLAALDSQELPAGPLLVAEVAGEIWAAVSLRGEPRAIADPFQHTADLVGLLRERANRLTRPRSQPTARQPAVTVPSS
jgi:hypothetical protein